MWRMDRRYGLEAGLVDLGEARGPEQAKPNFHFRLQQLQHAVNACLPGGGKAIKVEPADRHGIGAERNAFDDVGASAESAVDNDLRPSPHGADHVLQNVYRSSPMVELASTMVGDVDAVDAVIAGDDRIFRGLDALDDHRQLAALAKALDLRPAQRRLVALRERVRGRAHEGALGDVALAAAIDRNVDSEGEGVIPGGSRAIDDVLDPGIVATHVELKHLHSLRGGRGRFEARLGYRADHLRHSELTCGACNRGRASRIEALDAADRR